MLVAVAVLLLAIWFLKNRKPNFKAAYSSDEGDVIAQDDYFGGGAGFVPGGVDDTDSLDNDPNSDFSYVKPAFDTSEAIVGAREGGNYTRPYVPVKPPRDEDDAPLNGTRVRILR